MKVVRLFLHILNKRLASQLNIRQLVQTFYCRRAEDRFCVDTVLWQLTHKMSTTRGHTLFHLHTMDFNKQLDLHLSRKTNQLTVTLRSESLTSRHDTLITIDSSFLLQGNDPPFHLIDGFFVHSLNLTLYFFSSLSTCWVDEVMPAADLIASTKDRLFLHPKAMRSANPLPP